MKTQLGSSFRYSFSPRSKSMAASTKTPECFEWYGVVFALYPTAGDMDAVHLDSVSDWHMERIYVNQAKRHGLHVESTGDA